MLSLATPQTQAAKRIGRAVCALAGMMFEKGSTIVNRTMQEALHTAGGNGRSVGAAIRSTTILSVRRGEEVVMVGDGQVSMGETVMKTRARKVRRLYDGQVLAGFAGSTADALTLIDKFESKLEEYRGNTPRAAVELAKEWRTDKALRNLEALLVVCDSSVSLLVSGTGDVIEPDEGIVAVGSGGAFAEAAAKALVLHSNLPLQEIALEAMKIAADICVYTNHEFVVETLPSKDESDKDD